MEEILRLQNPWWTSKKKLDVGVIRKSYIEDLTKKLEYSNICLLLGGRRVGKTTLIYQYINKLIDSGIPVSHILYVLLDTFAFNNMSIHTILQEYRKIHNISIDQEIYIFLDEVQYKDNWEQELKNIYDIEKNVHIIVTGSASFKIHVKTAFLTGRHTNMYMFPLTFKEFLEFKNIDIPLYEGYRYINILDEYLKIGGYPEYISLQEPDYFSNLVDSIVYKDFVEYYNIRNLDIVRDLLKLIADRSGSHTSLIKLGKILGISKDTVREYITALKETFNMYELERFAFSRNERIYFPKKYYINDNGLLFNLCGKLNRGQAAERTLFDFLQRKYKDSLYFFYNKGREIDFLIKQNNEIQLIESKYIDNIDDFNTTHLFNVLESFQSHEAIVVTESIEKNVTEGGNNIHFIPLWKYLLT